jgi:hypothetical protein
MFAIACHLLDSKEQRKCVPARATAQASLHPAMTAGGSTFTETQEFRDAWILQWVQLSRQHELTILSAIVVELAKESYLMSQRQEFCLGLDLWAEFSGARRGGAFDTVPLATHCI